VSLDWLANHDLGRDQVRALIVNALGGAIAAARDVNPGFDVDPSVVAAYSEEYSKLDS
jgi:hypothetical protein